MAIHFQEGIADLVNDLTRLGYSVESVCPLDGSPGRCVDVNLKNNVVVSWDRYSRLIWVSGPYPRANRIEQLLGLYYEGALLFRWGLRLWATGRVRAHRFLSKKIAPTARIEIPLHPSG